MNVKSTIYRTERSIRLLSKIESQIKYYLVDFQNFIRFVKFGAIVITLYLTCILIIY